MSESQNKLKFGANITQSATRYALNVACSL